LGWGVAKSKLLAVKESSLGLMFCTCHCLALSFKELNAGRNGKMVMNVGANVAFLLQIKDSHKPCETDFNAIGYNAIH
jgi:hypothetical protein